MDESDSRNHLTFTPDVGPDVNDSMDTKNKTGYISSIVQELDETNYKERNELTPNNES